MKKKRSNGKEGNRKDKGNRQRLIYEGTVVQPIKDIMLNVRLDHNNEIVLGYLSGNIRRNRIRVMLGDRVKIEISDSYSKKGRIVYRIPRVSKPNSETEVEQIPDDHQAKKDTLSPESSLDTRTENPISSDPLQSTDQGDSKETNPNQDLAD
uniref:translation initiation factor 1 n=1 Tax=Gahnia tristis TaxID=388572 RepID=UPI001F141039|nr:translation initiation factor 1 [Gahnia tristis]YP_010290896.1 translation initiation factor 1 [Gahnia tristis]ULQ66007.1 translation initiation factor 1 [Gahnia tristis]ULQ66054.1 translation initiation factor 1 [Gahnia tristis]